MCSIFGYYNYKEDIETLKNTSLLMKHRGPDSSDYYIDKKLFLGHNRLAIIDIENNTQPLEYKNFVIVFNGEIYNYKELNKKFGFDSTSDTKTLILMYEKFKEEMLFYLRGMFAFCIYDKTEDKFFCARDRVGEKPFYYHLSDKFIFASEINPIKTLINPREDKTAKSLYYSSFKHYPAPYTPFESIHKLPPATYMIVKNNKIIKQEFYWKLEIGKYKNITLKEVKEKVLKAVKRNAVADVEIAILLSGGVDSSIIAYCLKELGIKFKAYTFGKDENDEELKRAKLVAHYLGIELKEIYFDSSDLEIHKKLIKLYGEPVYLLPLIFAYKLYNEIKKDNIKVVLTGNGADELFFGYVSHPKTAIFSYVAKILRLDNVEIKKKRVYNSMYHKDKEVLDKLFDYYKPITEQFRNNYYIDFTNFIALFLEGALPMTIIGDLAGMANSVEVRSPFFDADLIEFAYNIHPHKKIGSYFDKEGSSLKKILKDAFYNDLPKEVFNAKKIGFGGAVRENLLFGENAGYKFAKWAEEVFKEEL